MKKVKVMEIHCIMKCAQKKQMCIFNFPLIHRTEWYRCSMNYTTSFHASECKFTIEYNKLLSAVHTHNVLKHILFSTEKWYITERYIRALSGLLGINYRYLICSFLLYKTKKVKPPQNRQELPVAAFAYLVLTFMFLTPTIASQTRRDSPSKQVNY